MPCAGEALRSGHAAPGETLQSGGVTPTRLFIPTPANTAGRERPTLERRASCGATLSAAKQPRAWPQATLSRAGTLRTSGPSAKRSKAPTPTPGRKAADRHEARELRSSGPSAKRSEAPTPTPVREAAVLG
jgi:hypothetical protein